MTFRKVVVVVVAAVLALVLVLYSGADMELAVS